MPKPVLLNTGPMMPLIEDGVARDFEVHRLHEVGDQQALLKKIGPTVSAICTGSHTGVKTDAAMIAHCPGLKIIANFGVGYDTIDIPTAAKRGIVITNTPDVLTEEVADTALGLLLCTVREFYPAEKWLRDGRWAKEGDYRLTAASSATGRWGSPGSAASARQSRAASRRLVFPSVISAAIRRPACAIATTMTSSPWHATSIR